jgi:hypothetical protein
MELVRYFKREVYLASQRQKCTYGRCGESDFRIEIFTNIRNGQKCELGRQPPELVLLAAPYIHEYFYTKNQFSTPGCAPTCRSGNTWCRPRTHPRTHACASQQQLLLKQQACIPAHESRFMRLAARSSMHVCRFMHASACRFMHACQLLLMHACA